MIDVHLHCENGIERFIAHLDAIGVDKAWALALDEPELKEFSCPTELGLEAFAKYPGRVVPFCHVNIRDSDAVERILEYAELGCRGFGEHKMHLAVDDDRMTPIYEVCNDLRWPFVYHFQENGMDGGYSWGIRRFESLIQRYNDIRFVGHAGSWWDFVSADATGADALPTGSIVPGGLTDRLLTDYPNLYADLSAGSALNALTRDPDFMREFIVRHRKKLMWGTDCPCDGTSPDCFAKQSLPILRSLTNDKDVLDDILHNNAQRLV